MRGPKRFASTLIGGLFITCLFQCLTITPCRSEAPSITSVSPATGSTSSTTGITIRGENFEPGATVSLLSGGPVIAGSNHVTGHVSVSGGYAYVADGESGLKVLDTSNFSSPEPVGSIGGIGTAESVYVYGDHAYVTVDGHNEFVPSRLRIIDISDPASPRLEGSVAAEGTVEFVSGDYAYLTSRSTIWYREPNSLTIVDISDPASPEIAGTYEITGNAYGVHVSGDHAYLAYIVPECCGYVGDTGLLVIDITDPADPVAVGSCNTPGNAFDVYVSGKYAYVAAGQAGLQVVDISEPTSPVFVGSLVTLGTVSRNVNGSGYSDNITGSVYSIHVVDDYAYLVGQPALLVVDVGDPEQPVLVASQPVRGVSDGSDYDAYHTYPSIFKVYVSGGRAFVSDIEGMLLVDVGTPVNPAYAGTGMTRGEALSVRAAGGYAYVNSLSIDEGHGVLSLSTISVADSPGPELVASTASSRWLLPRRPAPDAYYGMDVAGDYVYAVSGTPSLVITDISDPASPVQTGSVVLDSATGYGTHVIGSLSVSGDHAYVTLVKDVGEGRSGRLWIVDVGAPAEPATVSGIDLPGEASGVHVNPPFAYIATGDTGLVVVDVSDPEDPSIVSRLDTPGSAKDVHVSDGHAYIADGNAGVSVVDVEDPTDPRLVGNYDTPGLAGRIHVAGSFAYVADGNEGLMVINISDPAAPFLADSIATPKTLRSVHVSGDHAYLANGHSGLVVTATHAPVTGTTVVDPGTITATLPADLPAGSYHILVTNPGGQGEEAYLYNAFKAEPPPAAEAGHCGRRRRRGGRPEGKGHWAAKEVCPLDCCDSRRDK